VPAVTVIIPTYNRADLLPIAVRSVLGQTFQDFEILIVDDGSTDDTPATCRQFTDSRVRYIRHSSNKGIAAGRNTGVRNAQGRLIAFLDDDDEWLPSKLQQQVDVLCNSSRSVGAVYTAFEMVDKDTLRTLGVIRPAKSGHILHELCMKNWIGTASTVCLKRECFEEAGSFDEKVTFGEEYDMWIRVAHRYDFKYIDEPLVKYGVHPLRLSTNYEAMIGGLREQLAKHGRFFALDPVNHSRRFVNLGVLYCYTGNVSAARTAFRDAIRATPLAPKLYAYLALSMLGVHIFRWVHAPRRALVAARGNAAPAA
jgi:glycosyltransferase involved in cell wall biosynthesis